MMLQMSLLNATESQGNNRTGDMWLEQTLLPNLLLGACFLVGIPGNSLVVWMSLIKFSKPRSVSIDLIVNLAVADLIALLTVPFWMYNFANRWLFGEFLCKLLMYLVYSTVYASIFLIMLMSLHRFAVVVLPVASQKWRRLCVVRCALLAVWLSEAAFASPNLLFTTSLNTENECRDEVYGTEGQQLMDNIVETLFSFVIPFAVLSICYSCVARKIRALKHRKKMNTGKLIAAMVGAFFICWLPYHIFNLLTVSRLLLKDAHPEASMALLQANERVGNLHWAVAFLSSCLNPVLYAFASWNFHGGLREFSFTKLFGKMCEDMEEERSIQGLSVTVRTPRVQGSGVAGSGNCTGQQAEFDTSGQN